MTFTQLATISLAVIAGVFAYTFCYTLNEQAWGGHLPFLLLTMSPIVGFALGRISDD